VVWNTPDIGVAPATLAAGAASLGTSIAQAMNNALAVRLQGEAGVRTFDMFGLVDNVVQHPDQYGLIDVTNACGAILGCDPSRYLFWDGIHPTSAGHLIVADAMLALAAIPEPSSTMLLFVGLLCLALAVHRRRHARSTG
jgi:outer membrane lipase/esterase